MPQLTKGARRILEDVAATMAAIEEARQQGHKLAIYNPRYAQERLAEIGGLTERLRYQLRELEPLLERQAPQYDKRLEDLERRVERLEKP